MAQGNGRAGLSWLVTAAVLLALLVSTGLWNPFPAMWQWVNESRPLADPPAQWQDRLGGVPSSVTLTEQYVVIEDRDSVEVRSRITGQKLWSEKADWAAVSGPEGRTVVITGMLLEKGYAVRDLGSGRLLRTDERAAAVWSFAEALLDVLCRGPKDCELTAREPASGDPLWQVGLPGIGFVLFADNPRLTTSDPLPSDRIEPPAAPQRLPGKLGFPIEGRVHVVDTVHGQVLPPVEADRHTSLLVLGGRMVYGEARPHEGTCRTALTGRDAQNGAEVWQRAGYRFGKVSSIGCEQNDRPKGGGNAVVALRPDGQQVLLDAGDGREVLVCAPGERILATDGVSALVQAADGSEIRGYALGAGESGRPKLLWAHRAGPEASAAVSRTFAIVSDRDPDRITVLDLQSGTERATVHTDAIVVAFDADGLVLADKRELGYVSLTAAQSE